MLLRYGLAARRDSVFGKPAPLQWLKIVVRAPIGPVTGTDDVVNEIAFIVDQHLLGCDCLACVSRHNVVVVKLDDLAGSAEFRARFAVP